MTFYMILKTAVLLILSLIAAVYDHKTLKIPNWIPFSGIIIGGCLCESFTGLTYSLLGVLFIFIFGMFGFMGMGDLKLWMMITMLVGFTAGCFIIASAAVLLILDKLLKERKTALKTLKLSISSLLLNKKVIEFEQKGYAFAPYLCTACFGYAVYQAVHFGICI